MRHLDKVHTPLVLTIGTLETPEFQRQSRDFAAALTKAGKPVKLDRRQGPQSFRDGRVAQQSLRDHGPRRHGNDEADDRRVTKGGRHETGQDKGKQDHPPRAGRGRRRWRGRARRRQSRSAQRCPATPPARTKGPAIWLDYDQHDMNEMYDQCVFAFNQKHVLARSDANNKIATATIGKSERFAYGDDADRRRRRLEDQEAERAGADLPARRKLAERPLGRLRALCRALHQCRRAFRLGRFHQCARDQGRPVPAGRPVPPRGRLDLPQRRRNSAATPSGSICAAARRAAISPAAWSPPTGTRWACRAPCSKAR